MAEARRGKVVLEKHSDGFVAHPVGLKGIVVGQGDTFEEALTDVKSAVRFHLETFGSDVLEDDSSEVEVFVSETAVSI